MGLAVVPDANATDNIPKAYLTVLFFDERFRYVEEGSAYIRVSSANNSNASLTLANIKAPKNGYVYIYVSNTSDEPVYFDNFKVAHTRGRIVEEDHYYAFGLKIAGISSKKLPDANEGGIDNKYLYNDKELFEDGDLGWYDYGFRNYDAQIGRFIEIDPLTDEYATVSGYHYALNDPIGNIDVDGLFANPAQMWQCAGDVIRSGSGITSRVALGVANIAASAATRSMQASQQALQAQQVGQKTLDGQRNSSSSTNEKMKMDEMESQRIPFYAIPVSYVRDGTTLFKNSAALALDRHNDKVKEIRIRAQIKQDEWDKAAVVGGMLSFLPELLAIKGLGTSIASEEIHFMQSSIKNVTGDFTVLGNAKGLKSGMIKPEVLRIDVWKDATGKIWALDNRRLAAFKLSGLKEVPIRWASPSKHMWKMTTTNGGNSIWLKFGGGNGLIVK